MTDRGRLVRAAAWCVASPMMAFVVLRLLGVTDRSSRLFAIATLTPWILLPAYGVVAVGVITRARALATAGLAVVVLHAVWVVPDLPLGTDGDDRPRATEFVVAAANLNAGNAGYDRLLDELLAIDADVLVVVEVTAVAQRAFDAAGIRDAYPHRIDAARPGHFGTAIHSRFPIDASEVLDIAGIPMAQATIDVDGDSVDVVAVHTRQPLAALPDLRDQLALLEAVALAAEHPVILAGDFNATRQHAPFRALLDPGLRDAHVSTGRGLARTWPAGRRVPPFALLDHVLVSEKLAVLDTQEVTLSGSDHRAVVADLATTAG